MSSPKIIVKSGYIKSVTHALNILEYSGNKIAAQAVVFADGSKMIVDQEDIIHLNKAEQEQISGVEITFKDAGSHVITYQQYRTFVDESAQTIRVDELTAVLDEGTFVNAEGKQYHEMKDLDFFKYLSYIEARPGAEKMHGHGLFGLSGDVSIEDAKEQALAHEKSIKWSHIISLPEKDGVRLGYDTRDAWANLIKAKAPQIAKAYNISLGNLVINAAYHSNTDNDHCHLLFYSRDEREGYVKGGKEGLRKASERLKSLFVNEIYRNEIAVVITVKNEQEQELKVQLKELLDSMGRPSYAPSEAVPGKLIELADAMRPLKGKREYGYLPASIKQQVDDILKSVVQDDKTIQELYNRYMDTNRELVSSYYADTVKIDERMKTMEQSFFSPDKKHDRRLHNIIVGAAVDLDEQLPGAGRASNEGENQDYRATGDNASGFLQSEDGGTNMESISASFELNEPEDFAASDEGENRRYHVGGGRARGSEKRTSIAHQFIRTNWQSFYRKLADSTVNRTSDTYTRLAYIRERLSAYPPNVRYDALQKADKAEIIRIAYAVLHYPADPSERNAHNIIARKLLLDKGEPKELQNTVMHFARNLNEISAKTAEYQRREKINAAFAALRMCVSLGHAMAQMAEDNHTSQQGQRNESKLERSFKHRKKEKYQNIAEY